MVAERRAGRGSDRDRPVSGPGFRESHDARSGGRRRRHKDRLLERTAAPDRLCSGSANASGGMTWVLRANRPAGLAGDLRRAIAEIDSRQRVGTIRTMEEIVASTA